MVEEKSNPINTVLYDVVGIYYFINSKVYYMRDIKKEIKDIKLKIEKIHSDPEVWHEYPYTVDNYNKDMCIKKYGKCVFELINQEEQLYKELNLSRMNKIIKNEKREM